MKKTLSIVAPMYNEEEMAPLFYEALSKIMDDVKDRYDSELVLVNDGSKDNTLNILKEMRKKDPRIHIVSFSRNYGHEPAIKAGLKASKGDAVVIMDADLQDPPEVIYEFLKLFEEGYEVVNGKRSDRHQDSFLKRFTAEQYYNVIYKFSGKIRVPKNIGNFRLMSRRVVDIINELPEKNPVLRVMVPYVGFKTGDVEFVRPARPKGETHYNFTSMFKLAGDSIISSSLRPLIWPFKFGLGLGALSGTGLLVFIIFCILNMAGVNVLSLDTNRFLLIIFLILFMFSLLFVFIGIIGQYIGRSFVETQDRPLYYVEEDLASNLNKKEKEVKAEQE